MSYRLLALDLDGTVLDPYGQLTPGVRRSIAAARRRDIFVVLCTGRRFRTAVPLARELELSGSIVVNNGVLVKDIESGATRQSCFLAHAVRADVLALIREVGTPLLYVDARDETDVFTENPEGAHPFQRAYLADAAAHVEAVPDVERVGRPDAIMISTMGDTEGLEALQARARERLGDRITTQQLVNKNYEGSILEFRSPETSKWFGLSQVARELGVERHEIVAVGDDTNDISMLRNAGLGIAMGNAKAVVKNAADRVVRSNAEGGAIEAIELAILKS